MQSFLPGAGRYLGAANKHYQTMTILSMGDRHCRTIPRSPWYNQILGRSCGLFHKVDRGRTVGVYRGKGDDQVSMEEHNHKVWETQNLNQRQWHAICWESIQRLVCRKGNWTKVYICGAPSGERAEGSVQLDTGKWNQEATQESQSPLHRWAPRSNMVTQNHPSYKHKWNSVQPSIRCRSNATNIINDRPNTNNTLPEPGKQQGPETKFGSPGGASRANHHVPSCIQKGCRGILQPTCKGKSFLNRRPCHASEWGQPHNRTES